MESKDLQFSWSPRRRRLWLACKRRYAFTYIGARGGFDHNAPLHVQKLHALRNHMETSTYVRRVINELMRHEFYSTDENSVLVPFADRAKAKFATEFERMTKGIAFYDHRHPMLRELANDLHQIPLLRAQISKQLEEISTLLDNGSWNEWRQFPTVTKRQIPTPLAVQINELKCYCSPIAAAVRAGEYWILEGISDSNYENEIALIHKYYALNELNRPPDKVRSFVFSTETGEITEFGKNINIGQAMKNILRDTEEFTALPIPDDITTVSCNLTHCDKCPFKPVCIN